jgi:hypothetical protein
MYMCLSCGPRACAQASGGTLAHARASLSEAASGDGDGSGGGSSSEGGSSSPPQRHKSQFEDILAALGTAAYEKQERERDARAWADGGGGDGDDVTTAASVAAAVGASMSGAVQKRTTAQVRGEACWQGVLVAFFVLGCFSSHGT